MKTRTLTLFLLILLLIGCGKTVDSGQLVVDSGQLTVTSEPATSNPPPVTSNPLPATRYPLPATDLPLPATDLPLPATNLPLERDPVALAMAYRGLTAVPAATPIFQSEPLPLGTVHTFNVLNTDSITIIPIQAELQAVGDHAYFWIEQSPDLDQPSTRDLADTAASFDAIYEQVTAVFGREDSPGIDGDPRIHVLSASPLTLCDTEPCGILGYFSGDDALPASVNPNSNEREMFVMNGRYFGTTGFLDTLTHEFRHMVEANYDANDVDWAVEGSAMLAEDLLGFPGDPLARANAFLTDPDQQLNTWTEGDTTPYYGQGYLLSRYIYDRLGPDIYPEFATHPADGLEAVTAVAQTHNLGFDGYSLWLDWLAALAIHDQPGVDGRYTLPDGLDTAAMTHISRPPYTLETTVHQFAADYYQLPANQKQLTLTFDGSPQIALMPVKPHSGEQMWLANRANYSQAQLTHAFDLRGIASATLHYAIYHDIERGYDFAYVAASTDGGQTWQGLTAPHMQGQGATDDPSDAAFTDRFYTSTSNGWVQETVDLTPFAGQEILLRFEYVTDPILTHAGLALDDIRIPEIGFTDDAASDQGWQANGFIRATGTIPQIWHVLILQSVDSAWQVTELPLTEGYSLSAYPITSQPGAPAPIVIVAAAAPMTLQTANYRLTVNK